MIAIADLSTGTERRATVSPAAALVTLGVLLTSPVLIGIGVAWKVSTDAQRLNARYRSLEIERANYRAATEALTGRIESLQGPGPALTAGSSGSTGVAPEALARSNRLSLSATPALTVPVQEKGSSQEVAPVPPATSVAPSEVAERVDVDRTSESAEREQLLNVLSRLSQKRAPAEEANAQTLASRTYQEATALELEARQLAGMGRTAEALLRALAAEVRFYVAESEARQAAAASVERVRQADAGRVTAAETVGRTDQGQPESSRRTSASAARTAEAENSIRGVIAQYLSGLESRNLAALKRVWPSLGGSQEKALRTEFANARAVQALFSEPRITIDDDTTTVTGLRSYGLETRDGQYLSTTTRTTITLRRLDGQWLIQEVVHRP
jgi:hypothetical protein